MSIFGKDKHIHHFHTETNTVPYEKTVTVHEHKAPTDDSVKILRELEEKAKENVIAAFRVEKNSVTAMFIYRQADFGSDKINFTAKFDLNGKEHRVDAFLPRFDARNVKSIEHIEAYKLFAETLSHVIAVEIMKEGQPELKQILQ